MSESERQMYLLPFFFSLSICLLVFMSANLPAGTLSACNSVFCVLGIILFTDTANNVLFKLPVIWWPAHAVKFFVALWAKKCV